MTIAWQTRTLATKATMNRLLIEDIHGRTYARAQAQIRSQHLVTCPPEAHRRRGKKDGGTPCCPKIPGAVPLCINLELSYARPPAVCAPSLFWEASHSSVAVQLRDRRARRKKQPERACCGWYMRKGQQRGGEGVREGGVICRRASPVVQCSAGPRGVSQMTGIWAV